uniref:NADH dehydrogenase [ubiquinone] 1 alpha subcomplex assembly factor 8 n=1 Tax=Strix occidentalis caurina TaxID=311401 RepID=A0A8D0F637_STROC
RCRGGARRSRRPAPVLCRSPQASAYGRCVAAAAAGPAELRRDACLEEFRALQDCFARAVRPEARPGGAERPRRPPGPHPGLNRDSLQAKTTLK